MRGGPSFTDAELEAIKAVGAEDPKRLKTVGMCTATEAEAYIKAGNFHNWLEQPEGKRLLVATLRWHQNIEERGQGKSPDKPGRSDHQLGRHMAMHAEGTPQSEKDQLPGERNDQIFQTFVATMLPPGISDAVPDAALKEGLKVFNPETGIHDDFKDDVAHALAYGGRVNIRIPQLSDGQHGYELPPWLHITKENRKPWELRSAPEKPVYRRGFGTHHMEIGDNQADGTRGGFVEKGEIGATVQNWFDPHSHLYGLPVATGGMGNTDYHGDTILPNESYGHMFMGYKPPTDKRDGGLQIGLETAGPGGNAPLGASQRHVDLKEFGDWVQQLKDLEKAGRPDSPSPRRIRNARPCTGT
ncbi:hypothetical protein ACGFY9_14250 [Streptomyces sp. NPDC048504]|uniref:hypothetical protein n=1 Tax=Streptomyces sp. NPDC048504 TaxID=3365559 RepID=UPI0037172212